jgi:hypothetical protein
MKYFLKLGYWVVFLFWMMTFIAGFMQDNYHHLINTISELGAIGSSSQYFVAVILYILVFLNLCFCVGFYKALCFLKMPTLPSILSFAMPVSILWAAIFPQGNELHGSLGALPLLVVVGSMLSFVVWTTKHKVAKLRFYSLISFLVMLLIFTRFIQPFGSLYEGLVQRFFYMGWSIWTISISYFLPKIMSGNMLSAKIEPNDN